MQMRKVLCCRNSLSSGAVIPKRKSQKVRQNVNDEKRETKARKGEISDLNVGRIFSGGPNIGFYRLQGVGTVVKINFSHSKLREKHFFSKLRGKYQNPGGAKTPCPFVSV